MARISHKWLALTVAAIVLCGHHCCAQPVTPSSAEANGSDVGLSDMCKGAASANNYTCKLYIDAVSGSSDAQFGLAVMYSTGIVTRPVKVNLDNSQLTYKNNAREKIYADAMHWYLKSADQGGATAQLYIGVMYYEGKGVARTYNEAARWYRKAADQGNAVAQLNLGIMYIDGKGVLQDYAEAIRWIRNAADQGNANAMNYLGVLYRQGYVVHQDNVEAMHWFRKSYDQGSLVAKINLQNIHFDGLGEMQDKNAFDPYLALTDTDANNIGVYDIFFDRDILQDVSRDYAEAVRLYRKSADQGNALSQLNLGYMYDLGTGVTQDYAEAVRWYRKAADQGNGEAQTRLCVKYQIGEGIPRDYVIAHMWCNLAAYYEMRDAFAREMTREQIGEAQRLAREWKPKTQ